MLEIPAYVKIILQKLENSGFEAYIVGGCCRDILLGKIPHDWDITTSALPENIVEIFDKTIPTGMAHGTVTVCIDRQNVEVTTFRTDGEYTDCRRPDKVVFTPNLKEDLSRRDFTMNAIAMDKNFNIIDPFDGQIDIKNRKIRCVGKAEKRFEEDALRMFRAIRFKAQLGFEFDSEILPTIKKLSSNAIFVSAERIYAETCKILLSPTPQTIEIAINSGLFAKYLKSDNAPNLGALSDLPCDLKSRFTALCAVLKRDSLIENSTNFLKSLTCESKIIKSVSMSIEPDFLWKTTKTLPKIVAKVGRENAVPTASAMQICGFENAVAEMQNLLAENRCLTVKELDISGGDLMNLGIRGVKVGECLNLLLVHVLKFPNDNKHEILLELAEKH